MKKIKYLLLLCAFAMFATGCVKYNGTMTIKKDKSMEFTIIYAIDKSMMAMAGESGSLKEEDFDELKKEGYTVEKYSDDKFDGYKMTFKVNNIDEVSTDKDVEFSLSKMMEKDFEKNNNYMFKVVKDGTKSTYYAKFKFDSNDSSLNDNGEDDEIDYSIDEDAELPDEDDSFSITSSNDDDFSSVTSNSDFDLSAFTKNMDLSFNVNLPNSAISSNATTKEKNDKQLTWKLNYNGVQTIEFAFEIDANDAGNSNMLLYVGIGAGVLVLVAVVAIVISSKKKKPVVIPPVQEEVNNEVPENKE